MSEHKATTQQDAVANSLSILNKGGLPIDVIPIKLLGIIAAQLAILNDTLAEATKEGPTGGESGEEREQ